MPRYEGKLDESRAHELFPIAYTLVKEYGVNGRRDYESIVDAAQEVVMNVWKHREKYDPSKGPLSTWVALLARHHLINEYHKAEANAKRKKRYLMHLHNPEVEEKTTELNAALRRLPQDLAERIRFRYEFGLSDKSVGNTTGEPKRTVRSKLYRARKILKELIERDN